MNYLEDNDKNNAMRFKQKQDRMTQISTIALSQHEVLFDNRFHKEKIFRMMYIYIYISYSEELMASTML